MNVLPHSEEGYSSTESPYLSPTSSPAPGADPDHAWLIGLRARTPSPPPPSPFEVGQQSQSSASSSLPVLRAPAPRRLSPDADHGTHSILVSEKKSSGRRSRKNSRNVSFAALPPGSSSEGDVEKLPSPTGEDKVTNTVAAAVAIVNVPAVVVSEPAIAAVKAKNAPSSPRPRSRSAAVFMNGSSFPAPSIAPLESQPIASAKPRQLNKKAVTILDSKATENSFSVLAVDDTPPPAPQSPPPLQQASASSPSTDIQAAKHPTVSNIADREAEPDSSAEPPAVTAVPLPIVEEIDLPVRHPTPPKARQRTPSAKETSSQPASIDSKPPVLSQRAPDIVAKPVGESKPNFQFMVAAFAVLLALLISWLRA